MVFNLRIEDAPPDRHSRYENTSKGKARRVKHNQVRQGRTAEAYLTRPFVAWDGEGLNEEDGSHTYVLLASSDGARMIAREGLGTEDVLNLFVGQSKKPIHIGYGLSYDVNMILKDLAEVELRHLYTMGWLRWRGFYIQWRRGKSFSVSRGNQSFLIYDVLPFFQRSFVDACDEFLGNDWHMRETIIREKADRDKFTYDEIIGIGEYNDAELINLVRLADELKHRLHKVGIRIKRWDGPGAVAAAIYTQHQTKSHFGTSPDAVVQAVRYAYAGGRFEILRKGHSVNRVWQYDMRSAYPSAMRSLPCLAHGTWTHIINPTRTVPYGVYRAEVTEPAMHPSQPQPLWMRNKNGTVYFSEYSHGWYWTPEVDNALALGGVTIHEGWEWNQECEHEPFHFVEPMYNKRAALKKAKDGAQISLKLGLNSLYGKLAQQVGWTAIPTLKLPPYHSLEWAGYITSHCRAQVFKAALLAPNDVIAFETDAIFTRAPLPTLQVGTRLGEWDKTEYNNLTYLKSGMYWGEKTNGDAIEKCRGINKGSITRQDVINALDLAEQGVHVTLPAEQTRFITLGQALHQDFAKWRKWITAPRAITVALNGKRMDLMESVHAEKHDGWKETQEGFHDTEFSYQYPVAWAEQEHRYNMATIDGIDFELAREMQGEEMGFEYNG